MEPGRWSSANVGAGDGEEVLSQALRYNLALPVRFIVITNGRETLWGEKRRWLQLLQSPPHTGKSQEVGSRHQPVEQLFQFIQIFFDEAGGGIGSPVAWCLWVNSSSRDS